MSGIVPKSQWVPLLVILCFLYSMYFVLQLVKHNHPKQKRLHFWIQNLYARKLYIRLSNHQNWGQMAKLGLSPPWHRYHNAILKITFNDQEPIDVGTMEKMDKFKPHWLKVDKGKQQSSEFLLALAIASGKQKISTFGTLVNNIHKLYFKVREALKKHFIFDIRQNSFYPPPLNYDEKPLTSRGLVRGCPPSFIKVKNKIV